MDTIRKNIRQAICTNRKQLSPNKQQIYANSIYETILCLDLFKAANQVAFYLAHQGEVDTTSLLHQSVVLGKKCYVPKIVDATDSHMIFVSYHPGETLRVNRFGIGEPARLAENSIHNTELDLVLVPIVAFNSQGYRLGMGSGYYDRAFHFLKDQFIRKPVLLGLAYEFQKRDDIPIQAWDVALCGIVTEKDIYWRQ